MSIGRICMLAIIFLLSGCATYQSYTEQVDLSVGGKRTVYKEEWVRRSTPEVYIQPKTMASTAPSVLFIPLRITQQMDNPTTTAYSISRVIYQTWNAMQVFPAMEFSSDTTLYRRDLALSLGRARQADLVVGGFITYIYAGGTAGDTQVAVQIEAHDAVSGQLVWSIAQSGIIPASKRKDFYLFTTQTRLPSDPLQAIAKTIAVDTGRIIQNWMSSPPPATRMQQLDNSIRDTLFPKRDGIPTPRPQSPKQQENGAAAFSSITVLLCERSARYT